MNSRHVRDRGPRSNIDVDFVGLQNFIVDHDGIRRLEAGVALNDRTIFRSSQPFLHSLAGSPGDCILARFDALYVDAHITSGETVFRPSAGNMDRIGTRHERLCRRASGIDTCAAKFIAFDNSDSFTGACKPCCHRRPRLAGADNDCVEMLHVRDRDRSVHSCSKRDLPLSQNHDNDSIGRTCRPPPECRSDTWDWAVRPSFRGDTNV